LAQSLIVLDVSNEGTYAWQLRIWTQAARLQHARLAEAAQAWGRIPTAYQSAQGDDRVWAELAFFVFAVRNVIRYAGRLATTDVLRNALEICEDEIAGAAGVRNWIEHFDEYVEGKGRDPSLSTLPVMEVLFPVSEDAKPPFAYQLAGVIVVADVYVEAIRKMMAVFLGERV
jgi:hypothetical protein